MRLKMNKTIAITGASGFIGAAIADNFIQRGWNVIALVRKLPEVPNPKMQYREFDLSMSINQTLLDGVDYLIHCSYIREESNPNATQHNYNGTKNLLDLARSKKSIKIIFFSSLSAQSNAVTAYGKQKYKLQQLFNGPAEIVLRPGLVIGNGGVFGELYRFIQTHTFIPLIGNGNQPLQIVKIAELIKVVYWAIETKLNGTYTIATEKPITMKQLYGYIAKTLNKKVVYIPIPFFIIYWGVLFLNAIGIKKLPVSKDSLLGANHLMVQNTKPDLAIINIKLTDL